MSFIGPIKPVSFDLEAYRASRERLPPYAYRAIYADREAQWQHRNKEEALAHELDRDFRELGGEA